MSHPRGKGTSSCRARLLLLQATPVISNIFCFTFSTLTLLNKEAKKNELWLFSTIAVQVENLKSETSSCLGLETGLLEERK